MSLIDCKDELKLRWAKPCVLSVLGNDNDNADFNNILFLSKAWNYMFHSLLVKDNQKYRYYSIIIISINIFSNQTFYKYTEGVFWFI